MVVVIVCCLGRFACRYEQHMEWRQEPFEPGFVRAVNAGRSKMFCNICDKTAEIKAKRQQQTPRSELRV